MKKITVKLNAWGNSQGVRLPRAALKEIGITEYGSVDLDLEVVDGEIRLSPSLTPYQRLMKKGQDQKSSQDHTGQSKEMDWGPDVGREKIAWERTPEEQALLNEQAGIFKDEQSNRS